MQIDICVGAIYAIYVLLHDLLLLLQQLLELIIGAAN